jgi:hypothetical protein
MTKFSNCSPFQKDANFCPLYTVQYTLAYVIDYQKMTTLVFFNSAILFLFVLSNNIYSDYICKQINLFTIMRLMIYLYCEPKSCTVQCCGSALL